MSYGRPAAYRACWYRMCSITPESYWRQTTIVLERV